MRSRLLISCISLICLLIPGFSAPELEAQAQPTELDQLYAVESRGHVDGSFSYQRLVYDRRTGQFLPEGPDVNGPDRTGQTNHDRFQRLLVRQSSQLRRTSTLPFRWAEKAPAPNNLLEKHRRIIRDVMTLVHQRKGHPSIPRFTLLNAKLPVRDIPRQHPQTHERDPLLEYQQFDNDSFNVLARTADNRFFEFDRPDVTSRAIRFEFASCTLSGGVFRCPFSIVECDIYLRAGGPLDLGFFEDLTVLRQRQTLAGHYKFCQGHTSNAWGQDLSGNMNRELNQATFNNNGSRVWKHQRQVDSALYGTVGAAAVTQGGGRLMLPDTDTAIDLGFLKPPIFDPLLSSKQNAFMYDAMVLTSLKGFSPGKALTMEVFKGRSTQLVNRILFLKGNSIDRRLSLGGRPATARYIMSYLSIGRKPDWDKLRDTVVQPQNEGKTVRGRAYDYVMEITVRVKGFLTENGGKQTVQQRYQLVYNLDEERDPPLQQAPFTGPFGFIR